LPSFRSRTPTQTSHSFDPSSQFRRVVGTSSYESPKGPRRRLLVAFDKSLHSQCSFPLAPPAAFAPPPASVQYPSRRLCQGPPRPSHKCAQPLSFFPPSHTVPSSVGQSGLAATTTKRLEGTSPPPPRSLISPPPGPE